MARIKPGDILEIVHDGLFSYIKYMGRHSVYGDAIAVGSAFGPALSRIEDDYFEGAYVTFYPVSAALRQGMVRVAGKGSTKPIPGRLRRPFRRQGRTILSWVIESDGEDVVKHDLSYEEKQLPIASIWNHEFLVEKILEGWSPLDET